MLTASVVILASAATPWRQSIDQEVALLGAGNWICVVDAEFPALAGPGIRMLATGEGHFDVLKRLATAMEKSAHANWRMSLDEEVASVKSPWRNYYFSRFYQDCQRPVTIDRKPYDPIACFEPFPPPRPIYRARQATIAAIADASRTHRILILKTTLTTPRSACYVELVEPSEPPKTKGGSISITRIKSGG